MISNALCFFKSKLRSQLNSEDRRAKIQDSDFIIGLMQAVAKAKGNFTLAQLRLSTCAFLGAMIGTSAFNERLGTAGLVNNLQAALTILRVAGLKTNNSCQGLKGSLGVDEIIGIDASMVSLWDGLSTYFKGTFMEAAMKLHLAINLVTGAVQWFDITPGATHDSQRFPSLSPRQLYVFDLGYWSGLLLQKIVSSGAFFLSRVKSNATLTVTTVVFGMGQSILGHDLLSFPVTRKRKNIVDLMVTMTIGGVDMPLRALGFWHKRESAYRWYVTNLTCNRSFIYDLYRLRWQIELSFKSLKSTLNFDQMPTLNPNAVKAFTLIALLNYVFAVIVRQAATANAVKSGVKNAGSASIQKAAKLFAEMASLLFEPLKLARRVTDAALRRLTEKILPLLGSVFDPNYKKRKTTLERLQAMKI